MSKPVNVCSMRGTRYWVQDGNTTLPKGQLGECVYGVRGAWHPLLKVPVDGDTWEELDTIIHEALHACTELNETCVDESATSIAILLWRLGWRKDLDI
jgi:hypothetical protein